MSDKNIDKDLEILKEVQGIFEHLKIHGWINDIEREVDINKVILTISRAIEYIKNAELTKIACCTAQNCEALNNSIRLGKELETWKKIAEFLAEELSKHIWLNDKDAILKIYREKVEEDETYS